MSDDKLSVVQRRQALVWFEQGVGWKAAATMIGGNRRSFQQLYDRWKIHGEAAVVPRQTKTQYTAEFKREVVERFLAGESKPDLQQVREPMVRLEGDDGTVFFAT